MNKVKKQFNDFRLYCRLSKYGNNLSDGATIQKYIPVFIGVVCGLLLAFIQFLVERSSDTISIPFGVGFLPFACGAAIHAGMISFQKPSLMSVAPFTPRQRMVFSFLETIIRAFVLYVIFTVAFFLFLFIAGCFMSLAVGEFVFVYDESFVSNIAPSSPCELAFRYLFCMFYFFSYAAISNINSTKYRNIATVCFFFGVLVLSTVFTNVCGYAVYNAEQLEKVFFFTADINKAFLTFKSPWIVVLVLSILTAASIAAYVFTTIKRFKTSKI